MIAQKAISKDTCNNFVKEIQKSKAFDDMIMGGRSRINKGSQNFKKFIKSSTNAALYCIIIQRIIEFSLVSNSYV